jgi:Double zinc ribbon
MPHLFEKINNFISRRFNQENKAPDNLVARSEVSENDIYCRFCGRKNSASRTSCQVCKMRIDVLPSQVEKVCSKCGSAVNNDDIYCFRCGTVFDYDVD